MRVAVPAADAVRGGDLGLEAMLAVELGQVARQRIAGRGDRLAAAFDELALVTFRDGVGEAAVGPAAVPDAVGVEDGFAAAGFVLDLPRRVDHARREEDDDFVPVLCAHAGAEEPAEERDVAEEGDLGIGRDLGVGGESAEDDGLPALHGDVGAHFSRVDGGEVLAVDHLSGAEILPFLFDREDDVALLVDAGRDLELDADVLVLDVLRRVVGI